MTPIPTLIEALGFPGLELEEKLSTVPPPPKRWAVHPSPSDRKEAKRLLVQQRRADPSFKDPAARNRIIFLTKKAVQKRTDEDAWQFSLHEIGRAIDSSFFNFDARHQSSVGIVASLFELGEDQDVQGLWNHARDASFRQGGTIRRMLKGLTGKQTARANPCPWLEKVTAQGSVAAAVLLCQVGVTPASLNKALELALTNKQYDTARELMRFGAKMPTQLALYERAVSKSTVPDETFVRLWLSTAPPIPRRECAIHAMARAANSRRGRMNQILSLLLANIPLEAEEACMLLQRALNARNLGGAALLSLAINEKWEHLSNEDISKTAAIISEIDDNGIRYKALHFLLLLFGPRADNAVLRALMLEEAKAQHLAHLELLVRFGVFPGEWTRPSNNIYTVDNSDTLAWAVASADIVVLRMLGQAQIPSDVASSVVSKIPINATDSDKVAILKSLCENHGASGWRLSQQLLVAVQRSSQEVITTLLAFGATVDYIDEGGQNSLLVAVKRGNEALARQLCRTDPPVAVVSDCVPVAFEAMTRHNDHHMLAIFSLLVSKGARGAALEKTVIKAISTEFAASVLQILLRAGMQSAAWGQAVERAAKSAGSDILDLLCKAAPQAPVASLEAALTEVMHGGSYNPEKARILASQAQKQGHFSFLNELLSSPKRESLRHRRSVEDILLAHGANINAAQGAVLVDAVKGGNLVVLRQLLSRRPDEASMANALQEALALTGREARLEVVECLVGHGVSSNTRAFHLLDAVEKHDPALLSILFPPSGISWSQDRQSLAVAVRKGYVDEVRFLLDHGAPLSQVVSAFDYIIRAQAFSGSESLAVATSLLGQGLDQAQLDRALAAAFMRPTSGHAGLPRAFVKLLLDHGAQADAARGKYFLVAAAEGDAGVLGLLATRGFRASTVLEGLIKGVPDVRQVLWSINTIVDKSTSTVWPGMALKWAISYFPGSRSLVERLLDLGCDQSNILLWALTEQNRVLDDVLHLLIDREKSANLNETTADLEQSAAHLAVQQCRITVLRALVARGVETGIGDSAGFTPLCHAASLGSLEAMRALVDSDSHAPDDGSLHIAARMANPDQVSLLIQRGHDVSWPSERLGGRTPAAELCLAADGSGQKWERAVKQTMRLLFPWPNASRRFDGKTVLHLAIENPKAAVSVLRCVLELTDLRLQPARDEDYLFVDKGTRLHYSPTKYIEYLCPRKSALEKAALIALLKTHDLKDRFFAPIGRPQPPGAEGLPSDIQKEVDEQELASLKYDQEMKREDEMARKKAQISEEARLQMLRHMESQAQMEIELARKKSEVEVSDIAKKQSMNLEYQEEAASSQLRSQQLLDNQLLSQTRALKNVQLDHKKREGELGTHLQMDRETKLHQTRLRNQRLEGEQHLSQQRVLIDAQLEGRKRGEEMATRLHIDRVNKTQQQELKGQKSLHKAELEQAKRLATVDTMRVLAQSPSNRRLATPVQRQIERAITEVD